MFDVTAWWDRLANALQHPAFHAAFVAILVGIAMSEFLAHLLPSRMRKRNAERVIRVFVVVAVSIGGYWLHPTTIGAAWALFADLAAPSVHHHVQSWAYAKWPDVRPRALR